MSEDRLCGLRGLNDLSEVEELESERRRGYDSGVLESKNLNGTGLTAANEGVHLGHHRGLHSGIQIGYYYGVVIYHLAVSINTPDRYNERTVKLLAKLKDLIEIFPSKNVDQDIEALTLDIQAQYKKLCSLLKIKPFCPEENFISF